MSKKLNEDAMASELAGSAFFQPAPDSSLRPESDAATTKATNDESVASTKTPSNDEGVPPRAHATTPPSQKEDDVVETIRHAVKHLGKEEATYRLTVPEKKAVADLVYGYSLAGIKTSQNEITRIAVNQLLEDHRQNGDNSMLARVIERLNE